MKNKENNGKCLVCGKSFYRRQGGKYCSRSCFNKAPKSQKWYEAMHKYIPSNKGIIALEEIECLTCGKVFVDRKWKHLKYCSPKCASKRKIWNKGKHLSEEHKRKISESGKGKTGEKCFNWKGGKSFERYGLEFSEKLKEKIRKRDNYRCQECFRHQDELFKGTKNGIKPYKLHIHHIDYDKKNNTEENLISLCLNCHMQTNWKREDWTNYYKNRI